MPRWYFAFLVLVWGVTHAGAPELHFVGQYYPPFNWEENGAMRGAMVDVVRRACELQHVPCRFSQEPLARGIRMLQDGQVHGVMALIPNAERAKYSTASPHLMYSMLAYAGSPQAPPLEGLNQLDQWTVGVVRASFSGSVAAQHKAKAAGMQLLDEVSNETLIRKLQGGRYGPQGAIFGAWDVLAFVAAHEGVSIKRLLDVQDQPFSVVWSNAGMGAAQQESFNQTLRLMLRKGEVQRLVAPYGLRPAAP